MTERITVGQKVRDRITGFSGIAITRTEHLYGCRRVAVQPMETGEDGSTIDPEWFDEPQLELIDDGIVDDVEDQKAAMEETGGPKLSPERKQDAG